MLTRRAAIAELGFAALTAPASADLLRPSVHDETASLRGLAAAKGLVFGCATGNYQLRDANFAAAFLRDCAILAPEYELKRDLTEPSPGYFDFSASDALMSYAKANGLLCRGHPLLWYASNPPWLEAAVAVARDRSIFAASSRRPPAAIAAACIPGTSSTKPSSPKTGAPTACAIPSGCESSGPLISMMLS